jgi:hypothetical protein
VLEVVQRDQLQKQVDALAPDVAHFETRKEKEMDVSFGHQLEETHQLTLRSENA